MIMLDLARARAYYFDSCPIVTLVIWPGLQAAFTTSADLVIVWAILIWTFRLVIPEQVVLAALTEINARYLNAGEE